MHKIIWMTIITSVLLGRFEYSYAFADCKVDLNKRPLLDWQACDTETFQERRATLKQDFKDKIKFSIDRKSFENFYAAQAKKPLEDKCRDSNPPVDYCNNLVDYIIATRPSNFIGMLRGDINTNNSSETIQNAAVGKEFIEKVNEIVCRIVPGLEKDTITFEGKKLVALIRPFKYCSSNGLSMLPSGAASESDNPFNSQWVQSWIVKALGKQLPVFLKTYEARYGK